MLHAISPGSSATAAFWSCDVAVDNDNDETSLFKLIKEYIDFQGTQIVKQFLAPLIEKFHDRYIGRRFFDHDLTFVMERLTDANLETWFSLSERSWEGGLKTKLVSIADPNWSEKQKKYIESIDQGALAYRNTLFRYEELRGESRQPEVWISYALVGEFENPLQPITPEFFPRIEMVVTVLTHSDAPVVVHIGISRTIYHLAGIFRGIFTKHENLAIPLHAFTAEAMGLTPHGSKKKWMITQPTHNMLDIFERSLPRSEYVKGLTSPLPQTSVVKDEEILTLKLPDSQVIAEYAPQDPLRSNFAFLHHKDMIADPKLYFFAVNYSILGSMF